MHVVIAGCGRVGSSLAKQLVAEGHEVALIDEDPDAFELVGEDFPAQFVIGQALDWDVLRRAGVARCDDFVTTTDGDNTNLVVAQVAKEHFGATCAVARVFDPLRAELFAQTGIRTVCPTADARELLHEAVLSCSARGR